MTRAASRAGRPRRFRGDHGATIVEAAFVTPVFFLLVFGIMEFGWLYKDWMSVANASHDGAREGSASGVDAYADYNILFVIQRSLAALSKNVDYIIVFKASGPNDPVPGACKAVADAGLRGVPSKCNVYYPADWNAPSYGQSSFGYDAVANPNPALLDLNWPGLSRSDHKTDPGPDWLGVFVQATHDSLTGISAGNQVLTKTSVIQIEATRK
ncbi:MAG: TadE/TadG family type IV pilus assembly protein [Acidimicrobiales bacterium]